MEKIVITELDIERARSYVPVREKEEFVDYCYQRCMNKVTINLGDEDSDAMPNMYMENTFAKSKYLMSALLALYLNRKNEVETVDGDEWLMTDRQYDLWCGSQVLGQIERLKRKTSPEIQDKVYDLLRDYKDLERRLGSAIYNGLDVQNDPINRMFLKLSMGTSEEALASQMEAQKEMLESLKKEVDEYVQNKKENMEG